MADYRSGWINCTIFVSFTDTQNNIVNENHRRKQKKERLLKRIAEIDKLLAEKR